MANAWRGETMDNVDFERLNLSDVERIEIVRGAASALYGSNAAGGVINIITRQQIHRPYELRWEMRNGRHDESRQNLFSPRDKGASRSCSRSVARQPTNIVCKTPAM